jgi:hypothetical protein
MMTRPTQTTDRLSADVAGVCLHADGLTRIYAGFSVWNPDPGSGVA